MAKKSKEKRELTPAVGYLRKSTKGTDRSTGKERQEKSLSQQKREIERLAGGRFEIVDWYTDEGVSGWKRGSKRPDFKRMLEEVSGKGAEAILCDNIDRFSRASVDEVQVDAYELRKAGVRWIVTVSNGEYDLGQRNEIGAILKFVVAIWAAHEYSRQLGRRITLARRNAALEGKRTGGEAPYGLSSDGDGGLKFGDKKQKKTIRLIFDLFVNRKRSINSIADELNRKTIPGPKNGGQWYSTTVREVMKNKAYRGDFVFNQKRSGQFFRIDKYKEVVDDDTEQDRVSNDGGIIVKEGVYKPLVEPELFDAAQQRLEARSTNRGRRKSLYTLSGILKCDHCGGSLYGCKPNSHVIYRCGSASDRGSSACKQYQVRESEILPFLMSLLGEEIKLQSDMLTAPPDELRDPGKERKQQRQHLESERDLLTKKIKKGDENLLFSEDARTRASLDRRISGLRDDLERIEAQLTDEPKSVVGYSRHELAALSDWWKQFFENAVSVPFSGEVPMIAVFYSDPSQDLFEDVGPQKFLIDSRIVHEALIDLGAEVRLRWQTETYETSGGKARNRHVLKRGRFRLGQLGGRIRSQRVSGNRSQYVLEDSAQRPHIVEQGFKIRLVPR